LGYIVLILFFFSSRRRHTRFSRDWSSDVCSSDLPFRDRLSAQRPKSCVAAPSCSVARSTCVSTLSHHGSRTCSSTPIPKPRIVTDRKSVGKGKGADPRGRRNARANERRNRVHPST